jgi:hypothetical protein
VELIDLRLTKKSKKELNKGMEIDQPKYPYGFQLRFDSEQVAKLPQLEKVKIGEKVTIQGIGEVVEVRKVDRQKENNQFSVEIQLKQIGVEGSTLIGAIEKGKKGELK